jgi:hypothetical protein
VKGPKLSFSNSYSNQARSCNHHHKKITIPFRIILLCSSACLHLFGSILVVFLIILIYLICLPILYLSAVANLTSMFIGKLLVLPAQLFCCCLILPVCLFFYKLVCFVLLFNALLCLPFAFC